MKKHTQSPGLTINDSIITRVQPAALTRWLQLPLSARDHMARSSATNRKTISQTQFKALVKGNSVGQTHKEPLTWRHGKKVSVSGAERLQARSRHGILCSGRRGNMKAETWDNKKINDQSLSRTKTHYRFCGLLSARMLCADDEWRWKKNKTATTNAFPHSNMYQPSFRSTLAAVKIMCAVATLSSQNAEHEDLNGCLSPPTRQHNKCCSQLMQNCLAGRFIQDRLQTQCFKSKKKNNNKKQTYHP